jgi:tetratricopeptide (TPR) repeat protein
MRTLLLLLPSLLAQSQLDYSTRGSDHFYNLEYDEAIADFELAGKARPQASIPHYRIAQALLYRELYRSGGLQSDLISSNNSFLKRPKLALSPGVDQRLVAEAQKADELAQARLNANANDTGALYDLCMVNALQSNYDFLVRKDWKGALKKATTARKLCGRVVELEPSNYDARIVQGVHEYIVGSLPWYYRSLGFLAGFHGDRAVGIRTLEEVADKGINNRVDAEILLSALYRRENQHSKALPLLGVLAKTYPRNYLLSFELAVMYSEVGDKEKAIATMDRIAAQRASGVPGFAVIPWGDIWYQRGDIQFAHKDLDQALENFQKATAPTIPSGPDTTVLALLRMGQIYDLKLQRDLATQHYKRAIASAPESEAARDSKRYMEKPYRGAT